MLARAPERPMARRANPPLDWGRIAGIIAIGVFCVAWWGAVLVVVL